MRTLRNKIVATTMATVMLAGTAFAGDGSTGGAILEFLRAAFGAILE